MLLYYEAQLFRLAMWPMGLLSSRGFIKSQHLAHFSMDFGQSYMSSLTFENFLNLYIRDLLPVTSFSPLNEFYMGFGFQTKALKVLKQENKLK